MISDYLHCLATAAKINKHHDILTLRVLLPGGWPELANNIRPVWDGYLSTMLLIGRLAQKYNRPAHALHDILRTAYVFYPCKSIDEDTYLHYLVTIHEHTVFGSSGRDRGTDLSQSGERESHLLIDSRQSVLASDEDVERDKLQPATDAAFLSEKVPALDAQSNGEQPATGTSDQC